MAKGIRQYVEAQFTKLLPKLQALGGQGFRRQILDSTVEQFDISMASASAAYNYVINKFREENPAAVAGLGRSEAGLNVIGASAGKLRGGGRIGASAARPVGRPRAGASMPEGNVTLVEARNTDSVVVDSIPRPMAKTLVAASGRGRNNPKLAIQQDLE
jgi:hypothetical protein